jgi:choline monooxygenase
MFSSTHSLRHLLRPEHYYADSHSRLELDQLFRPAWQFVCACSEIPRDGDFLTMELLGTPLLVRNSNGQCLAYENVCTHRHCLLTDQSTGHQPQLRCQYHGWEFDDDGRTAKIPEARCFRPWDRENSRLNMFRAETCGDLLFVSMNSNVPSLKEWLSPYFHETAAAFDPDLWKMGHVWEYDCPSNWKVPLENTLESYHVTSLHRDFFGATLPAEENVTHVMDSRYTALTFAGTSRMERMQARLNSWLGGNPTLEYRHRHYFPNTVLNSTDTINYALMYLPTSPTTVRVRMRLYWLRGRRRDPISQAIAYGAWRFGLHKTLQVHNEDRGIYESQQRGLEKSRHPGVIGMREERIYAFQKYLVDSLAIDLAPDKAKSEDQGG